MSDTEIQLEKPDNETELVRKLFNEMKGSDAGRYQFSHISNINDQKVYVFKNIFNYRFVNVTLNESQTALKPYFG